MVGFVFLISGGGYVEKETLNPWRNLWLEEHSVVTLDLLQAPGGNTAEWTGVQARE